MSGGSTENTLARFVRLLDDHGVEFLIIGGQAEVIFGSPRRTEDVDVCYRRTPENLRRLAEAIGPLNPQLRGAPPGLPFRLDVRTLAAGCNFTLQIAEDPLDLLGIVEPIGDFDAVARNAESWRVAGRSVRTISLADLIKVKEHIGREKDAESLYQLRAIRQKRMANPNPEPPSSSHGSSPG